MTFPSLSDFTFFSLLFLALDVVVGCVIAYLSICAANRMVRPDAMHRRFAYTVLCGGGVSLVLSPFFGSSPPEWPQVAAHCSVALLFWDFDRQQRSGFK